MDEPKKVLVEAIVVEYGEYAGKPLVRVEIEGGSILVDVDPSLIRTPDSDGVVTLRPDPEPQDWIDRTFGGPPPGTVEVDVVRWQGLDPDRRVRIITTKSGQHYPTERYFEVKD